MNNNNSNISILNMFNLVRAWIKRRAVQHYRVCVLDWPCRGRHPDVALTLFTLTLRSHVAHQLPGEAASTENYWHIYICYKIKFKKAICSSKPCKTKICPKHFHIRGFRVAHRQYTALSRWKKAVVMRGMGAKRNDKGKDREEPFHSSEIYFIRRRVCLPFVSFVSFLCVQRSTL